MFARVENGGTEFWPRKKNAKMLDQKQQFSIGNQFVFFGRGKNNFWGGITSKLAGQCPSWGIYKVPHPFFGAKDGVVILKKGKRWPTAKS